MSDDYLTLKWGTIKEVRYSSERVRLALERYYAAGPTSMSAAMQEDNPAQKEALCDLIEVVAAVGGAIKDDWTGKAMTADEAKRYVQSGGSAEDERGRRIGLNLLRALAKRTPPED
ncbi:hypothetical protein ACTGJ9_013310 [Bradyrhizobium sp. RDM12]